LAEQNAQNVRSAKCGVNAGNRPIDRSNAYGPCDGGIARAKVPGAPITEGGFFL